MRRASSGSRDDARTNTGFLLDAGEKLAAVARLTRGAGGRGQHGVHLARLGQPVELRQRLQCGVHRLGGEGLAVETAGAEPDHGLLAIDDLEGQVLAHPHDEHVDGIRADIDRCYAHEPGAGPADL